MEEYERLLNEVEAMEDVKLYDKAKSSKSSASPVEDVFRKIGKK